MVKIYIFGDYHLDAVIGESMKNGEHSRRSITVRPEVDEQVRDMVSTVMGHGKNFDYTKALNMFAELGGKWLEESSPEERAKLHSVIEKYLDYELFDNSFVNDWAELAEFRRWKKAKADKDSRKS